MRQRAIVLIDFYKTLIFIIMKIWNFTGEFLNDCFGWFPLLHARSLLKPWKHDLETTSKVNELKHSISNTEHFFGDL